MFVGELSNFILGAVFVAIAGTVSYTHLKWSLFRNNCNRLLQIQRVNAIKCADSQSLTDEKRVYIQEVESVPVSYTHLDVYKRQPLICRL